MKAKWEVGSGKGEGRSGREWGVGRVRGRDAGAPASMNRALKACSADRFRFELCDARVQHRSRHRNSNRTQEQTSHVDQAISQTTMAHEMGRTAAHGQSSRLVVADVAANSGGKTLIEPCDCGHAYRGNRSIRPRPQQQLIWYPLKAPCRHQGQRAMADREGRFGGIRFGSGTDRGTDFAKQQGLVARLGESCDSAGERALRNSTHSIHGGRATPF